MTDHDLLAGAIAARLRLEPEVRQLYPPRPALRNPVRSVTALLSDVADQPAVTVTGADVLDIEASIGVGGGALEAGRAAVATILDTLPAGSVSRIRVRIAAID